MLFIIKSSVINTIQIKNAGDEPLIWLMPNDWDDYSFKTSFKVFISLPSKKKREFIEVGLIKIIKAGQKNSWTKDELEKNNLLKFDKLPKQYCSLGQSKEFYSKSKTIFSDVKSFNKFLSALNDITHSPSKAAAFENSKKNPGFHSSLVRDSEPTYLFAQAQDKHRKSKKRFSASIQMSGAHGKHTIGFDFSKKNGLPHRMCVLVGKNGVGKTQILARIAIKISGYESSDKEFLGEDMVEPRGLFNNVLALSFSAFDDFEIPPKDAEGKTSYRYCGLRDGADSITSFKILLRDAVEKLVNLDSKRLRFFEEYCQSIFPELGIEIITKNATYIAIKERRITLSANGLMEKTSAGQRIVLAVLINLITHLKENTLVIFDEPETHLHPSLLTTLLSLIDDMLIKYKSYAIISTHSALVLQQVPSKYIRVIRRLENTPHIGPPPIETFGENLTEITQKVFEVHDGDKDYRDVLIRLLKKKKNNPKEVMDLFENRLGVSARSFLYSLSRDAENNDA